MKKIKVELNKEELTLIISALSSVNNAIYKEASRSHKKFEKAIVEGWFNGGLKNKALFDKLVKILDEN